LVSTRFTDRNGGFSNSPYASFNLALHVGDHADTVDLNRNNLMRDFGPAVFMTQVHGNTVFVVHGIPAHEPIADALVSQQTGITLVALVADCIPLLLWDEDAPCIAAVHVGRRGLVNGITSQVIEVMRMMGATNIQGHLGPSICGACYEVGSEIYEEVGDLFPAARARTISGALALDLPAALSKVLFEAGIGVVRSHSCTVEDVNFFSYRRDGITGRQAGAIWM
jgi:YfiH family protein